MLTLPPVQQARADYKGISTADCQPLGPGTTAGELSVTQNAIYIPGTTAEKIICPVNKAYYGTWDDTNAAYMYVYFKTGAVTGAVSCTTFVGSPAGFGGAVSTNTTNSGTIAANTATYINVNLRDSTVSNPLQIENANVVCTITPKVIFGGFFFSEPGTEI